MKSIRTRVAIGIIKLAAGLCGLALVIAPWPLADESYDAEAASGRGTLQRPSYSMSGVNRRSIRSSS
jgi:hypothetical protein